jgi:hypothetical protein
MTPFRKSIRIILHYPSTTLLALPGYLLLILLLSDFTFLSGPVAKALLFAFFLLIESLLLQPALSIHTRNILDNEPEKPFFGEAIRNSKLKLLALMLVITCILIALFIAYLLIVGIAAVTLPYHMLGTAALIIKYAILPIPVLFVGGWYLSCLPLLARPGISVAQTIAESAKTAFRKRRKTIPALIAAGLIIAAAYGLGQIAYYLANGISLLYLIDNPLPANYAGVLAILAAMPLYSWLICYSHCLQRSDDSNII